jgi:hypothetical protein
MARVLDGTRENRLNKQTTRAVVIQEKVVLLMINKLVGK